MLLKPQKSYKIDFPSSLSSMKLMETKFHKASNKKTVAISLQRMSLNSRHLLELEHSMFRLTGISMLEIDFKKVYMPGLLKFGKRLMLLKRLRTLNLFFEGAIIHSSVFLQISCSLSLLPLLENLNLSFKNLDSQTFFRMGEYVFKLKKLKKLSLSLEDWRTTYKELCELEKKVSTLKLLVALNLNFKGLILQRKDFDHGSKFGGHLVKLQNLKQLAMNFTLSHYFELDPQLFENLSQMKELKYLDIYFPNSRLEDTTCRDLIVSLGTLRTIKSFGLHFNKCNSKSLKQGVQEELGRILPQLPALEDLLLDLQDSNNWSTIISQLLFKPDSFLFSKLQTLHINLSGYAEKIEFKGFGGIFERFPNIHTLTLNFQKNRIQTSSFLELSKSLSCFLLLKHFDLNIQRNPEIGDESLVSLGQTIQKLTSLERASLNFSCTQISGIVPEFINSLFHHLTLTNLVLVFDDCSQFGYSEFLQIIRKFYDSNSLQNLHLSISGTPCALAKEKVIAFLTEPLARLEKKYLKVLIDRETLETQRLAMLRKELIRR